MSDDPQHHPDSRPGDFIGRDVSGRIKIDRVIPLPWLVGICGAIVAQAAAMYYGQQQIAEAVRELKGDVRELTNGASAAASKDVEHTLRIQAVERRVDILERAR